MNPPDSSNELKLVLLELCSAGFEDLAYPQSSILWDVFKLRNKHVEKSIVKWQSVSGHFVNCENNCEGLTCYNNHVHTR